MYTIYNTLTGVITSIASVENKNQIYLKDNEAILEAVSNPDTQKVNLSTKKVEDITYTTEELNKIKVEEAWIELRNERNYLIQESDYRILPDSTSTKVAEWKTYRQALRDLPANTSDPLNVTWPTPPE